MRKCHRIELSPGDRFGSWIVLEKDIEKTNKRHYSMYMCKCDCGEIESVRGSRLTNGYSVNCRKCGFVKMSNTKCGKNQYDLTNEYGIGWTTNTNEQFYFDLEDYDKIKDYTWFMNQTTGYVTTQSHKSRIDLQRFIMDAKPGELVDHIHGNESKNDYRKSNLRIATKLQNNVNVGLRSNNTSGATGVRWLEKSHKWEARIVFQHKQYSLGLFDDFQDAVNARKEAEKKYYGEFAYNISQQL